MKNIVVALVLPVLALTACSNGEETVAKDTSSPTATPTPTKPDLSHEPVPAKPKPGTVPDFAPQNYTFLYEVGCFCPDMGQVRVTVEDGEVVAAEHVGEVVRGQEGVLTDWRKITIQDMIDEANGAKGELQVDWPDAQAWPNSLFIDRVPMAADDEVTFTILEVQLAD